MAAVRGLPMRHLDVRSASTYDRDSGKLIDARVILVDSEGWAKYGLDDLLQEVAEFFEFEDTNEYMINMHVVQRRCAELRAEESARRIDE